VHRTVPLDVDTTSAHEDDAVLGRRIEAFVRDEGT
jgi:hypothetical protein